MTIRVIMGLCLMCSCRKLPADILLSASPDLEPEHAQQLYQPVAEKISQIIGQEVVYEHPQNWGEYKQKVHNGDYYIVFEQPHIAAWRNNRYNRLNYRLVGRFADDKQYALVVKNDSAVNSLTDLYNKRICARAIPDISTLLILQEFNDPLKQPHILRTRAKDDKAQRLSKVLLNKCAAIVVDFDKYNQLNHYNKRQMRVIFKTAYVPNVIISVNEKVSLEDIANIEIALHDGSLDDVLSGLIKYYSRAESSTIEPVRYNNLTSVEDILSTEVFGW